MGVEVWTGDAIASLVFVRCVRSALASTIIDINFGADRWRPPVVALPPHKYDPTTQKLHTASQ